MSAAAVNKYENGILKPDSTRLIEFADAYGVDAFKKEYKVSYKAIIYRLKNLEVISIYLYKNLSIYLNKRMGNVDPYPIEKENTP